MIVDTSALVAIVLHESDGPAYLRAILAVQGAAAVSAATLVELAMVVEGRAGPGAGADLDNLMRRLGLMVHPVTEDTARVPRDAWRRFGKGRHQAALNFGDCFSYALATMTNAPLRCKGDDFAHTDVKAAP